VPPAPVANFTSSCAGLTCSVDASSSTAQASATYSWSWGDATTGTGKTTSHTYGAGGTYSVTLSVTDAGGTSTKTQSVTVTTPTPAPVGELHVELCGADVQRRCEQLDGAGQWRPTAGAGVTPRAVRARPPRIRMGPAGPTV